MSSGGSNAAPYGDSFHKPQSGRVASLINRSQEGLKPERAPASSGAPPLKMRTHSTWYYESNLERVSY